jgi:hypothetical protein
MSSLIWPELPGIQLAKEREPVFQTTIQADGSGAEYTSAWQSTPRYKWSLQYDFLRQNVNAVSTGGSYTNGDEVNTLHQFFMVHQGQWDSFLFNDPVDGVQRRVRFDQDGLRLTRRVDQIWQAAVALISVK